MNVLEQSLYSKNVVATLAELALMPVENKAIVYCEETQSFYVWISGEQSTASDIAVLSSIETRGRWIEHEPSRNLEIFKNVPNCTKSIDVQSSGVLYVECLCLSDWIGYTRNFYTALVCQSGNEVSCSGDYFSAEIVSGKLQITFETNPEYNYNFYLITRTVNLP
jgi:hypothetical protein